MKNKTFLYLMIYFVIIVFSCSYSVLAAEEPLGHWAKSEISTFSENHTDFFSGDEILADESLSAGEFALTVNHIFLSQRASSLQENLDALHKSGYLQNIDEVNKSVSREEVSAILCRILALDYEKEAQTSFIDNDDISEWFRGYISILQKKEILIGYPDLSFKPQKNVTKAEFITMINRCDVLSNKEVIDDLIIDSGDKNSKIEVGILEYDDGKLIVTPIEDELKMESGEVIDLSVSIPDDVEDRIIHFNIKDEGVIEIDEESLEVTALNKGETQVKFYTSENEYECILNVVIE